MSQTPFVPAQPFTTFALVGDAALAFDALAAMARRVADRAASHGHTYNGFVASIERQDAREIMNRMGHIGERAADAATFGLVVDPADQNPRATAMNVYRGWRDEIRAAVAHLNQPIW